MRKNISRLSLNFENQRLQNTALFPGIAIYVLSWVSQLPISWSLREPRLSPIANCFGLPTSECWPGFSLLPHSSHRKQPGCHTFPREFLCSAAKYRVNTSQSWSPVSITLLSPGIFSRTTLTAHRSGWNKVVYRLTVVLQKNYFAIYWWYFDFKSFILPKYTSLPHLWHSVITFTAVSQAKHFDLSTSDEEFFARLQGAKLPMTSCRKHFKIPLSREGLGLFFFHPRNKFLERRIYLRSLINNPRIKGGSMMTLAMGARKMK